MSVIFVRNLRITSNDGSYATPWGGDILLFVVDPVSVGVGSCRHSIS